MLRDMCPIDSNTPSRSLPGPKGESRGKQPHCLIDEAVQVRQRGKDIRVVSVSFRDLFEYLVGVLWVLCQIIPQYCESGC